MAFAISHRVLYRRQHAESCGVAYHCNTSGLANRVTFFIGALLE